MSDWVMDIAEMHMKFGVNDWQYDHADDKELMQKYIKFRMDMIQEEVDETNAAITVSYTHLTLPTICSV